MLTITGQYTTAVVYTTAGDHAISPSAEHQLQLLCDNETMRGCKIRVMPDVHPGVIGTIGFTSTIGERLMPNLVGIDIGCGMTLTQLQSAKSDWRKLDTVIRDRVPSGFAIRDKAHPSAEEFDFHALYCAKHIQKEKSARSLGSLGGGNHFIEVDTDTEGNLYLVIHSGSRHLGKEVTEYYLNAGAKDLQTRGISVPYELTWLEGILLEQYMHDIYIVQKFAALNRQIISAEILRGMKWKVAAQYSCAHNYIDDTVILRKGAISARENERVIIPINMRDGILLGIGLGNAEWNFSAPHGAGRIVKREDVRNSYTLSEFKAAMKGIYSPSINRETLAEAPFAYRNLEEIATGIGETVRIEKRITPVYNFKAGGKD